MFGKIVTTINLLILSVPSVQSWVTTHMSHLLLVCSFIIHCIVFSFRIWHWSKTNRTFILFWFIAYLQFC